MCRAKHESGRRCPNCTNPERRSARDRARYAAATTTVETVPDAPAGDTESAVVELRTASDEALVATEHTADLLVTLTQDDIDNRTSAWEKAVEIEKQRIVAALAVEVPVLGEDPTPEEIARLAETIDHCYDEHTVTLLAAAPGVEKTTTDARSALAEVYGTPDKAVVAVGDAIARRGETHAGITAEEARANWKQRVREVRDEIEPLAEQIKALGNQTGAEARTRRSALIDQTVPLRRRLEELRAGNDVDTMADLARLADGYRTALAEVRDVGGDLSLHEKSSKPTVKVLAEAAQIYPTDWIEASNDGALPLYAGTKVKRGHYIHTSRVEAKTTEQAYDYIVPKDRSRVPEPEVLPRRRRGRIETVYFTHEPVDPEQVRSEGYVVPAGATPYKRLEWETTRAPAGFDPGDGWERLEGRRNSYGDLWVRPRVTRSSRATEEAVSEIRISTSRHVMPGRSDAYPAAVHELGHRMQHSVPRLAAMERDWRRRRTTKADGSREHKVRLYGKTDEIGWRDEFVAAYVGRDYDHTDCATEVLTVGVESLFGGENGGLVGAAGHENDAVSKPQGKADRDFRGFVLGAMASAGRRS